ncbi:MAG: hypothetical protein AAGB93_18710 [Planctomycetota bacterium]
MRRGDEKRERLPGAWRRRAILVAWAILLALSGAVALAEWLPVPPPTPVLLAWFLLGTCCIAVTLFEAVLQLLSAAARGRARQRLSLAASMLLGTCIGALSVVALLDVGNGLRARAFARAADRAAPLIAAIDRFVADNGAPPRDLDALVPEWIDSIPSTSLLTYPRFEFEPSDLRGAPYSDEAALPPTWSLRVDCARGVLNWDVFLYYPDGRYEGVGRRWGGWHEEIRGWAYVHE